MPPRQKPQQISRSTHAHAAAAGWRSSRRSRLSVRGKGRRETRLPLPQDAGDAVLAYLERARRGVGCDRVFFMLNAPIRPLTSSGVVSNIVRSAIRKAEIDAPTKGASLLRHSAATAMLRGGATLDMVGAVLRHRSSDMTAHYAKVRRHDAAAAGRGDPQRLCRPRCERLSGPAKMAEEVVRGCHRCTCGPSQESATRMACATALRGRHAGRNASAPPRRKCMHHLYKWVADTPSSTDSSAALSPVRAGPISRQGLALFSKGPNSCPVGVGANPASAKEAPTTPRQKNGPRFWRRGATYPQLLF